LEDDLNFKPNPPILGLSTAQLMGLSIIIYCVNDIEDMMILRSGVELGLGLRVNFLGLGVRG
jgi:hypothetical protein